MGRVTALGAAVALLLFLGGCGDDNAQRGGIEISVENLSGVDGYRLLAVAWSDHEELAGGAFWTIIDSDPFSATDVLHPPDFGDQEASLDGGWGADDYLWQEPAELDAGTYRVEFYAHPGELPPYGSHIPSRAERRCWIEVEVGTDRVFTVAISEIPRGHDECLRSD